MGLQDKVNMIQRAIDNGNTLFVYSSDGERTEITPVSVDSAFNGNTTMMQHSGGVEINIKYADIRES